MLKITEQLEFEDYLRQHPNEFSWKSVAEVLYRCGEESLLNQLFAYLKSPEGKTTLLCYKSNSYFSLIMILMLNHNYVFYMK